jgi:hypothetical protein
LVVSELVCVVKLKEEEGAGCLGFECFTTYA